MRIKLEEETMKTVKLEGKGQLYIIGNGAGNKTHLAYLDRFDGGCLYQLCLPNIPVQACNCVCPQKHDPDCGYTVGRREAEVWDKVYSDVTCPTCLKRARGTVTSLPLVLESS